MAKDPLIGRKLANFRIDRTIGRGGMAQVYYGQDVKLKRPVAIKVIDARHQGDPAYAKRFVREAQTIAKWRHEHIIQIYYADDKDNLYYFVMEYIDGVDLGDLIAKYRTKRQLMPHAEVLRIGRAVASALDYAHRHGFIHRDVKPSNVLVAKDGRVVLADFGLALDIEQGSLGEVFGSANYMAPEQARHSADAVPQSDLYSLGVILYEMLVGRVPFEDDSPTTVAIQHITLPLPTPRKINPKLSVQTEAVLLKVLSKSPKQRYQTGAELMDALEKALATPKSQRRFMPMGVSLGIILTAIIAAVFWLGGTEAGQAIIGQVLPAATTPPGGEAEATATSTQAEAFAPPTAALSSPASTLAPPTTPTLAVTEAPTAAASPATPPTPTPDVLPLADTQSEFSGSQGAENWEYQWSQGRDSFNWNAMQFDGTCWRTTNEEESMRICADSAHPGLSGDIAWRWTSEVDGRIRVQFSTRKLDTQGGDGVYIHIYRNTEELQRWQLGWNDSQGFTQGIELDIAQGDYLFLVIKAGADAMNDETAFRAQVFLP